MKLTNLEKASNYDVQEWLSRALELTPDQNRKLHDQDLGIIRRSPYYFYKQVKREPSSILWHFTIFAVPVYLLLALIASFVLFLIKGKWGLSQKFYDNFHAKWWRKLGL